MAELSEVSKNVLLLLSVPGLYCLLVLLGRRLKRVHRVDLGWMYHVFSLALAIWIPAALLDVHWTSRREILAVVVLTVPFFINALVKRYVWEVRFSQRRETRVPKLVSDATALAIFMVAILVVLRVLYDVKIPGLLAGSGIVAIILGLALQDLLGNIIAGFAIHFEQPFKAGDWLQVNEHRAQVMEINWRATRLRTRDAVYLDIPNRELVRQTIVNYHYPDSLHSLRISVPIDYGAPPSRVKEVLHHATANAKGVLPEPRIRTFLKDYREYYAEYEIQFWINDNALYNDVRDAVHTNVWYGLQRHGIKIALPVRTVRIERPSRSRELEMQTAARGILRQQQLFKCLSDEELDALLPRGRIVHFGQGEKLIEQGDEGQSMFILVEGQANVMVERNEFQTQVASLSSGDCFGEMSLLTGERRSATVVATKDCEVVEISKAVVAKSLKSNPELLHKLSELLAQRQMENEGIIAKQTETHVLHATHAAYRETFVDRLRKFFQM
ncbi:MAG TPA: mechanosensitive ion channel family protein [Verrucomicrobiae bacterium]|nr:mechanosensitive ion channel family protein [Verrucomicrobiae bacterium]